MSGTDHTPDPVAEKAAFVAADNAGMGDPTGLPELEDSEIIVLALQHYAVRHTSRAARAIGTPNHGEHRRRAERAKLLAAQFGREPWTFGGER